MEDPSEVTEECSSLPTKANSSFDELTLKLLPVELITSDIPPKIIEFTPETLENTPKNINTSISEKGNSNSAEKEDSAECGENSENVPLVLTNLGTFNSKKSINSQFDKDHSNKNSSLCDSDCVRSEDKSLKDKTDLKTKEDARLSSEHSSVVDKNSENLNKNNEDKYSTDDSEEEDLLQITDETPDKDQDESISDFLNSALSALSEELAKDLLNGFHVNGSSQEQVNTLAQIFHAVCHSPAPIKDSASTSEEKQEDSPENVHVVNEVKPDNTENVSTNVKQKRKLPPLLRRLSENSFYAPKILENLEEKDKSHDQILHALGRLLGISPNVTNEEEKLVDASESLPKLRKKSKDEQKERLGCTERNLTSDEKHCEHFRKGSAFVVKDLLNKALFETIQDDSELNSEAFNECCEYEQLKKDCVALVRELMKKADKLTKIDNEKAAGSNNSSPSSKTDNTVHLELNPESATSINVPIESIKEVSGESTPVGDDSLDCILENANDKLKSADNSENAALTKETNESVITEETKDINKPEENQPEQNQPDNPIPIIDITNTVKSKPNRINQLSRTNSEESPKSNIRKLGREFGSHETLSGITVRRPSLLTKNGKLSALNRSFIKLSDTQSNNPSRSSSVSESSGISTPKKGAGTVKRPVHKRSEIVEAVTQRLYNKRKMKQEEEKLSALEAAKMFSAKMRLQDLTQRALRASKRKVHVDTQTEDQSTIRMKEKATDVQDIAKVNMVVKDVFVEALASTQNIGITCQIQNSSQSLKLTGTSSTQTDEQIKPNQAVSFTKYLQNPPIRLHPYSQPIYTSSVNINVQHNHSHVKEMHSDDSLEECGGNNVHFSTPDLISNHNSLEQVNDSSKSTNDSENVDSLRPDKDKNDFTVNEYFATNKEEYCVAKSSFVQPSKKNLTNVTQPVVRTSETCSNDPLTECCKPLRIDSFPQPEIAHPIRTFEGCQQIKSMKTGIQCNYKQKGTCKNCVSPYSTDNEDTEEDCCSSHNKKVRFVNQKQKDMLAVVTNFLDEASSLLFKLNSVAKQAEIRERQQKYILPRMQVLREGKDCYVQTNSSLHDASSQTCVQEENMSSQTPDWSKTNNIVTKEENAKPGQDIKVDKEDKEEEDSDSDYLNVQTTSTDWKFCSGDFNSLDTIRSTSDYGSLPRGHKNRKNHYSPRAYMQHLIAMRRKIVEDSRNDILANDYLRLPSPELF